MNRRTVDICIVVCDGLRGPPEAIADVRPQAIVQTCVLHLIGNSFREASKADSAELARDATGVGAPVVDLFKQQLPRIPLYAITITSGATVTGTGQHPHVPKRDLITTSAVILEQRRLQIASRLPEATLVDELLAYRRTTSETGYDSYGAAAGSHDDLVLAVSLALWTAEHKPPPYPYRPGAGVPRGRIPGVDEMLA